MWRDDYEPDVWDDDYEKDPEDNGLFYDPDYDLARDIEWCFGEKK